MHSDDEQDDDETCDDRGLGDQTPAQDNGAVLALFQGAAFKKAAKKTVVLETVGDGLGNDDALHKVRFMRHLSFACDAWLRNLPNACTTALQCVAMLHDLEAMQHFHCTCSHTRAHYNAVQCH